MIISASRRTDIPTFYTDWFMNRIREGYLCVRNPFNKNQVSKIALDSGLVDCIVFWTKNPIPMLNRLPELDGYTYYFQFTLTGYGRDIEGNLPDKHQYLLPAFQKLSQFVGPERVIWRYDPIIFSERYTPEYHLRAFSQIAQALQGCTEKCVISFVDVYRKNRKNMEAIHMQQKEDEWLLNFAGKLQQIAARFDMEVGTCAETIDLSSAGISHSACIDKALIERLTGGRMMVKKDPSQRPECLCAASIDVGSYNTCGNGCRYCYANFSPAAVEDSRRRYNPASPILCDVLRSTDRITERPMKSLLDRQIRFLD
jgi:hypothetical protein